MTEVGVGLVGYGLAGAAFHAPVIGAVEGLRLRFRCRQETGPEPGRGENCLSYLGDHQRLL